MPSGVYKKTSEHKDKIAASLRGRKLSKEHCQALKEAGNRPEVKAKHSINKIRYWENATEEQRKSFSMDGRKHSAETKIRMTASQKLVQKEVQNRPEMISMRSGENCNLYIDGSWMNGKGPSYHKNFTEKFREIVRIGDNYICRSCGKTEKLEILEIGQKLSVHHTFYDEETNDCSNKADFISLCNSCHGKTTLTKNREFWICYFRPELAIANMCEVF